MPGQIPKHDGVFVTNADDDETANDIQKRAEMMSPLLKAANDVLVLLENIPYLPDLALPIKKLRSLPGVPKGLSIFWHDYTLVTLVSLLELPLAAGFLPAFLILPGWAFVFLYSLAAFLLWLLNRLLWGPILIYSKTTGFNQKKFPHERWLFLNGVATGHLAAQRSVNNLAATFHRPIFGVYNRTTGLLGDLIECLIQRSFGYSTFDVRTAVECIKDMLLDGNVHKIVVIAHSQGGIILSLVLDHLYTILPGHVFGKLEIYTFGNAAAQFHDPLFQIKTSIASQVLSESPTNMSRMSDPGLSQGSQLTAAAAQPPAFDASTYLKNRLISYIEHYCNENDPVPRLGVLYHVARSSGTTYAGRVFVRENASGHFFDPHYLDGMFPLDKIDDLQDSHLFMNHVVRFADRGVFKTQSVYGLLDSAMSTTSIGKEESRNDAEQEAVRVRDLSRLYRYVKGREP